MHLSISHYLQNSSTQLETGKSPTQIKQPIQKTIKLTDPKDNDTFSLVSDDNGNHHIEVHDNNGNVRTKIAIEPYEIGSDEEQALNSLLDPNNKEGWSIEAKGYNEVELTKGNKSISVLKQNGLSVSSQRVYNGRIQDLLHSPQVFQSLLSDYPQSDQERMKAELLNQLSQGSLKDWLEANPNEKINVTTILNYNGQPELMIGYNSHTDARGYNMQKVRSITLNLGQTKIMDF